MPRLVPIPTQLLDQPFTIAMGRAAGLSDDRMFGPDLESPFYAVRWRREQPEGVHPLGQGILGGSEFRLCAAFRTKMRAGQFFSHTTAAELWRVPLPRDNRRGGGVHVSTIAPLVPPRGRGVVGHRLTGRDVLIRDRFDFAVADAATTWCQLAELLGHDDLVAAGDHLVLTPAVLDTEDFRPYVTLVELTARVAGLSGRGVRAARRAILSVRDGAESRPESLVRLALIRAGLPEPELNVDIRSSQGTFLGRCDMVYRRWRVIVEYDGDQHRTDTAQYEKDIGRIDRLIAAGWIVVRIRMRGLFAEADASVARVEAALRSRGWGP